jgi:hypothetical protein
MSNIADDTRGWKTVVTARVFWGRSERVIAGDYAELRTLRRQPYGSHQPRFEFALNLYAKTDPSGSLKACQLNSCSFVKTALTVERWHVTKVAQALPVYRLIVGTTPEMDVYSSD